MYSRETWRTCARETDHFCARRGGKLGQREQVELGSLCKAIIDCFLCAARGVESWAGRRGRGHSPGSNLVVSEDEIGENLGELCSDLRWDNRIHRLVVALCVAQAA